MLSLDGNLCWENVWLEEEQICEPERNCVMRWASGLVVNSCEREIKVCVELAVKLKRLQACVPRRALKSIKSCEHYKVYLCQ